uniref:Uncharacterized protein n=1 Tax=uncultured prokaryote TaxID=198431 RepID=A0A0H5PYM3_9ZZZZ|nr:hypothetical protein [uncultured prokaryote]
MYTFSTQGKTTSLFPSLEATVSIINLNTFSNEGQKVYEACNWFGEPELKKKLQELAEENPYFDGFD